MRSVYCILLSLGLFSCGGNPSSTGTDSEADSGFVASTNFEKTIDQKTKTQIEQQRAAESITPVHDAYVTLAQQIETEHNLNKEAEEEYTNCRKMLVYRYSEVMNDFCNRYFLLPEWDETTLTTIRDDGKDLLASGLIMEGELMKEGLQQQLQTVDDYFAAKQLAASCGSFPGLNRAKDMIAKSRNYRQGRLKSCTRLVDELNQVPAKLYKSHVNYVNSTLSAANNRTYHSSADFEPAYRRASEAVNTLLNNVSVYGKSRGEANRDIGAQWNKLQNKNF